MKNSSYIPSVAALVLGLSGVGIASGAPKPDQFSGFLNDYSQLNETKDATGMTVLRFVSPRMSRENYQQLIIEPVQFFPEPKPTEQVTAETLGQIKEYADQALRREIRQKVPLVGEPGPGVARLRVALTAVGAKSEGLKPYQYVPVALVLTGARAAAGGHPQQASVFLEAEMTDSVSGERLAIAVRGGTGERLRALKEGGKAVSLDAVKPLLDRWARAYADYLSELFQAN
jgi:hypothetical protein